MVLSSQKIEHGSFAILRSYGSQTSAICDRNVTHNIVNSDRLIVGKKSARNLIYLVSSWIFFESKTDVSFGFEADVVVAFGLKEEINLVAAKFPPRCPPWCLLWFPRPASTTREVHLTFPLNEMYGYSRLCDRLRVYGNSSLCDPLRYAIVCDGLRWYGNQP